MTIQEGIGKRIRSLREFNKLSQTELAIKVGYKDKTSIAKIEAGKVDLPQSKIFSFAKNLGTTPSYILGDNEFPNHVEEKHSFINDNDKTILDKYRQLNDEGKQRLLERADELIELGYIAKGDALKEAWNMLLIKTLSNSNSFSSYSKLLKKSLSWEENFNYTKEDFIWHQIRNL